MSLNFRMLWIEDDPIFIDSLKNGLEKAMSDESLEPDILIKGNGEEVDKLIATNLFDLIVLDYQLPERTGDELIKDIHRYGELTEIIYYSEKVSHDGNVPSNNGVDCIPRGDVRDAIISSIAEFSKNSKSLGAMRGIIIAEIIDIENKLTEIIKMLFKENIGLFQAKILDKRVLDFTGKYKLVQSCLNDLVAREGGIDPNSEHMKELVGISKIFKKMPDYIIDPRNILAHSGKQYKDDNWMLEGLNGKESTQIVFNDPWKNKIRSDISKYRANIYALNKLFSR